MVKIIETDLSLSWDGLIKDHQSRIIESKSWEGYISAFENNDGKAIEFKSLTSLLGNSIQRECMLGNIWYDDFHMSCDVYHDSGVHTKKLAYLIK